MIRAPMVAILVACAAAACGDSGGGGTKDSGSAGNKDAASESGSDQGGGDQLDSPQDLLTDSTAGETPTSMACDPVMQTCGAGQKCDFFCPAEIRCGADTGTVAVGMPCGGTGACVKGAACLFLNDPDGGVATARCREFCGADTDCTSPERCERTSLTCSATDTPVLVGVCQ